VRSRDRQQSAKEARLENALGKLVEARAENVQLRAALEQAAADRGVISLARRRRK
jgi:hypothetical protein